MKTSDITVVFQGAVKPYVGADRDSFRENVRQTRRSLPNADIIVSTWKGAELPRGLLADAVIESDDPGGLPGIKYDSPKANNVNRQIVSTLAGLESVRTPYVVKLRTDSMLEHAGFLDFAKAVYQRDGKDTRILANSFFTLDPTIFERLPFHLSDWFHFGRTDRLLQYWSAPPVTPVDASWYDRERHIAGSTFFERNFRARFAVEQHLCMHYASQHGYVVPQLLNDGNPDVLASFERFIVNETLILDPWQIGLRMRKYEWVGASLFQRINTLMYLDWLAMSGSSPLDDSSNDAMRRLIDRRRKLKSAARAGFRASRPLHRLMFSTQRGFPLRRAAVLLLGRLQ
ncbi:WavE lipopolysaccharide synthesis family protein [Caballeronia sp. LZ062]|uniref:WavE lipopolysaccharide synthesis family protein n=1 Tax=unclassified Caballeronia TaxID=2646786 RepID=UPI00285D36A7|nr:MULTISPECIES: WavE lipopolysaccharide synthesis family protein [unclassified Caballeronia]MDR5855191.1 WavE lipopolysaccharide synthesis family protein [Caballeronia sp. LZ050]MDR5870279.1 WavE lipopolysaccharide synthesis family protein [Caballeronia sp. LZ062]